MSDSPRPARPETYRCGECGAPCERTRQRCWTCQAPLPECERYQPIGTPDRFSFSIASLLLATVVLAVVLTVGVHHPGLGVVMALVLAPIAARMAEFVRRRELRGERIAAVQKGTLLAASFAGTCLFLVLSLVAAFGTTCGTAIFITLLISGFSGEEDPADTVLPVVLVVMVIGWASWPAVFRMRRWLRDKRAAGDLP